MVCLSGSGIIGMMTIANRMRHTLFVLQQAEMELDKLRDVFSEMAVAAGHSAEHIKEFEEAWGMEDVLDTLKKLDLLDTVDSA